MKKMVIALIVVLMIVATMILFPNRGYDAEEVEDVFVPEKKTSIVKKIIPKEKPVILLFVGDMMFDRGVRFNSYTVGYELMFKNIADLFEGNDLVVGNLEGTVTNNQSIALSNSDILRFTFDPAVLPVIKDSNFDLLSLANNHSTDFYEEGLKQTKENLLSNQLKYFGSARNTEDISKKILIKDKIFCFFGYHDLYTHDETPILDELKRLENECHKKIVYPHWGIEYVDNPSNRQRELAQKIVEAGADLIVGSHPHVVQSIETFDNKAVFYSLGNFVFDQNFSFETMHSIALKVYFYKDKTIFEIIPINVDRGVVSFVDEETAIKVLEPIQDEFKAKKGRKNNSRGFILFK